MKFLFLYLLIIWRYEINIYKCTVTDTTGKIRTFIKECNSEEEVINSFSGSDFIPVRVRLLEEKKQKKRFYDSKRVLEFTQIMEQLLASGLSIKDALEVTTVINNKRNKDDIASILYSKIQKGTSFALAVNEMPLVFSSVYRGIITVGDKVGSVEKIFPRLRIYLETQKKIKDKFISALVYPAMVGITAIIAFLAMILFVFPKLRLMFIDFGGEAGIQLEANIEKMQIFFMGLLIVILILIIFGLIINGFSKRNKNIRFLKDTILLKLPIIGKFLTYRETLNFSFAMETLTAGGVTIENAIKEAKSVISNECFIQAVNSVHDCILRGEALSDSFAKYKIFPEYMTKWMYVGERSGKPEQVFAQIRNYFQNEIDLYTTKFMSLIEPSLIIIVGVVLIILIITIIVPVFSLYGSIL